MTCTREEREYGRTLPVRDPDHVVQLPAQGLGALQRPDTADQPEPGALLAARHGVRGQRADDLRPAGSSRAGPDARRERSYPWRASWKRVRHDHAPDAP